MTRPLQFPRPGTALPLLLLAALAAGFALSFWFWFSFGLTLLQQQYLPSYAALTMAGKLTTRPMPTEWIWKAGPHRAPALAWDADVVEAAAAGGQGLPLALSPEARAEGWTGLRRVRASMRPGEAEAELREGFYAGRSLPQLMILPLCGSLPFLLFALALRDWFGQQQSAHEERHGRRTKGPELASAARWRPGRKQDGIRLRLAGPLGLPGGSFPIPRRLESSHILLMGDTGSGKSNAIRQILGEVERRGEAAIVYDPAGEFTREFLRPERGDLLLNPLDARCPFWNLNEELDGFGVEDAIAAAMLPERPHENGFFTDAPRRVLAALLRRGGSAASLLEWMADPAEIERRLAGTPQAAYLDRKAGPQRAGVLASLNLIADSLAVLPGADEGRAWFSTSRWRYQRTRWVFLASRPALRERVLPLHAAWLDLLILRMMEPCGNPAKPVWFVLDELASLNRLPQLHTAVTESRKYGNPVVLGFQGRSQLEKRYGQDAEAMLSQPATKLFFRTSEPRAARWIQDTLGEVEVERLRPSYSTGASGPGFLAGLLTGGPLRGCASANRSWSLEIATKPLVMASELAGLPALRAYLKQGNRVTPLRFRYTRPRSRQPEFIDRKTAVPEPRALPTPAVEPEFAQAAPEPVHMLAESAMREAAAPPQVVVNAVAILASEPELASLGEPGREESAQPKPRRSAFRKGPAREWMPVD